jgi:hypothetical protein
MNSILCRIDIYLVSFLVTEVKTDHSSNLTISQFLKVFFTYLEKIGLSSSADCPCTCNNNVMYGSESVEVTLRNFDNINELSQKTT